VTFAFHGALRARDRPLRGDRVKTQPLPQHAKAKQKEPWTSLLCGKDQGWCKNHYANSDAGTINLLRKSLGDLAVELALDGRERRPTDCGSDARVFHEGIETDKMLEIQPLEKLQESFRLASFPGRQSSQKQPSNRFFEQPVVLVPNRPRPMCHVAHFFLATFAVILGLGLFWGMRP
jgi:hypothetical protein